MSNDHGGATGVVVGGGSEFLSKVVDAWDDLMDEGDLRL